MFDFQWNCQLCPVLLQTAESASSSFVNCRMCIWFFCWTKVKVSIHWTPKLCQVIELPNCVKLLNSKSLNSKSIESLNSKKVWVIELLKDKSIQLLNCRQDNVRTRSALSHLELQMEQKERAGKIFTLQALKRKEMWDNNRTTKREQKTRMTTTKTGWWQWQQRHWKWSSEKKRKVEKKKNFF